MNKKIKKELERRDMNTDALQIEAYKFGNFR